VTPLIVVSQMGVCVCVCVQMLVFWHCLCILNDVLHNVAEYDWSSNNYSSWSESIWPGDAFRVRIFLMPSYEQEVCILLFHLYLCWTKSASLPPRQRMRKEALRNGCQRTLRKRYEVLRSVTEHCGALHDITEHYGSVTELLRNVMEPLQKI